MATALPPQLLEDDKKFLEETKTATTQVKNITLLVKLSKLVFKSGLSTFFASILALNFMAFQIGISLKYPAILTAFFGNLMSILN